MFIDGFGISEYRSFGSELQRIGPFEKINLFVGQNNSGKSNILLFITQHLNGVIHSITTDGPRNHAFDDLDGHVGPVLGKQAFEIGLRMNGDFHTSLLSEHNIRGTYASIAKRIYQSELLTHKTDMAWFRYEKEQNRGFQLSSDVIKMFSQQTVLSRGEWMHIWQYLRGMTGGDLISHWIPETLFLLSPIRRHLPPVALIPAIRRIGEGDHKNDFSGLGIINRLADLQHPSLAKNDPARKAFRQKKEQFKQITEFVRSVTGNDTAELEIPDAKESLYVIMDGKTLFLECLGTGIHEVIILAAAATVLQNQIVCLEEPELHLHPTLQKKLIHYLQHQTTNQYFITTHSAHLMDTPGAAVFHVRLNRSDKTKGVYSEVTHVDTDCGKSLICADLGYRASDILQSNCIIWVEGPSDRLYLTQWIKQEAPDLLEGVHYSVMFYGGKLLSHLTGEDSVDAEVDEFISLRRLNRYISIVMDSDKAKATTPINQTKQRIKTEFDKGPGFAWVTAGREIENYIDADTFKQVASRVCNCDSSLFQTGDYRDRMTYKLDGKSKAIDKVRLARELCSQPLALDMLDLRAMVQKTIEFIRQANSFEQV